MPLKKNLPFFTGKLLDVGCGKMPYRKLISTVSSISEYIGLDIESALEYDAAVKADFTWDGVSMPFENDSFDTIMATEVLEHCPEPDTILNEIYRVLDTGGYFFFTVPFLWNLHEAPHDEYRYTPFALERLLKKAGFSEVNITATGGWHAALAQMLGLWVRRSPITEKQRKNLSKVLKPVISFLIKKDAKRPPVRFVNGQMITGLYGICKK